MKRDIAVAIFAGFVIGVIVALAATNLPQIIQKGLKISRNSPRPSITPALVETSAQNLDFTINSPKDESVSDAKTADISGRAKEGQTILLENAGDQLTLEASKSGDFTGKLNLAEGLNTIYVTAIDSEGNSNTKSINVYYTTEKL